MRKIILGTLFIASSAAATTSYTLSGSASKSHYGTQTHESRGVSGGINWHLSAYWQFGLNIRSQWSDESGYKDVRNEETKETETKPFTASSQVVSTFFNSQLNLLPHQPLIPFIFAGIVRNEVSRDEEVGETVSHYDFPPQWGPQGGVGAMLKLSRRLFLRLSVTASPGVLVEDPDNPDDVTQVTNTYTQVGINYRP